MNGAHSTLAYVGSLAGYETVSGAMGDATLASFVRRMMIEDIRSGLAAPAGLDLDQYIDAVLRRFRNPTIRHLLSQIAWDGSQKLPFRILPTITENLAAGRSIARLSRAARGVVSFHPSRGGDINGRSSIRSPNNSPALQTSAMAIRRTTSRRSYRWRKCSTPSWHARPRFVRGWNRRMRSWRR